MLEKLKREIEVLDGVKEGISKTRKIIANSGIELKDIEYRAFVEMDDTLFNYIEMIKFIKERKENELKEIEYLENFNENAGDTD